MAVLVGLTRPAHASRSPAESPWRKAFAGSGVIELLAGFDPRVAGTLPLGVSIAGSDIDLLCHAPEPDDVADCLWAAREQLSGLVLRRCISEDRPLVATFDLSGWPVEVFASPVEVDLQAGWRHFVVERRLLNLAGEALRRRVLELRRAGASTEPDFAAALGMSGDPYAALLRMQNTYVRSEEAVRREEAIADVIDHHLVSIPVDLFRVPVAAQLDDDGDVGVFAVVQLDLPARVVPQQLDDALRPQAGGGVLLQRIPDRHESDFRHEAYRRLCVGRCEQPEQA